MIFALAPSARLSPFVSHLWAQDGGQRCGQEVVLPTGQVHLVVRLEGVATRASACEGVSAAFEKLPQAVVGARLAGPYRRLIQGSSSAVGALLRPGAARALLGVPAGYLAGAHVAIDDLWPRQDVADLQERLAAVTGPARRLALLDAILAQRLGENQHMNPKIGLATSWLARSRSVGALVERLGCSHRHFTTLFASSVGMTPKTFQRLARFNRLLEQMRAYPEAAMADLAVSCFYADQAHMTREFRAFSSLTPAEYRRLAPLAARHVPMLD